MFESTLEKENTISKVSYKKITYLFIKRFFDILASLFGLLLIVPFILIVKIAYVMTGDFSTIFYKQTRIGKDGKKFKLYKIRSMVKDADKVLEKTLELDPILMKNGNKIKN